MTKNKVHITTLFPVELEYVDGIVTVTDIEEVCYKLSRRDGERLSEAEFAELSRSRLSFWDLVKEYKLTTMDKEV